MKIVRGEQLGDGLCAVARVRFDFVARILLPPNPRHVTEFCRVFIYKKMHLIVVTQPPWSAIHLAILSVEMKRATNPTILEKNPRMPCCRTLTAIR